MEQEKTQRTTGTRPYAAKLLTLSLIIYGISLINIYQPFLRFHNPIWNICYRIFFLSMPLLALISCICLRKSIRRVVGIILLSLLLIVNLPFAGLAWLEAQFYAMDDSYNTLIEVDRIEGDTYAVAVYYTSYGATVAPSVIVRQEKRLVGDLYLVKELFREYRRSEVPCIVEGDQAIINGEAYPLKAYVYGF